MIKYAADRGGLAGRVADVGLRAMKKRCVAVLTAALCLMLVLGLQACAGSGGGRPIQDPQAGTVLPEGAKKEEGVVLDASDGQFILRAAGGGEYVFRMDGAEDMVEGGVQAAQYLYGHHKKYQNCHNDHRSHIPSALRCYLSQCQCGIQVFWGYCYI